MISDEMWGWIGSNIMKEIVNRLMDQHGYHINSYITQPNNSGDSD